MVSAASGGKAEFFVAVGCVTRTAGILA